MKIMTSDRSNLISMISIPILCLALASATPASGAGSQPPLPVLVTNAATQPVPVALSGTSTVSGAVTVANSAAQAVPVSVQGVISVAPAVSVPYQQYFEIDFQNCSSSPNGCAGTFDLPAVSASQRLTITYVSCGWPFVGTPNGLKLMVANIQGGGQWISAMYVPAPYQGATAISAPATFYVNAGEIPFVQVTGDGELSGSRVYCNISGHLTQIPPT